MPRNVLMSDLVLRCQRRCDKENDDSMPALEWKALINSQYGELHQLVVDAGGRYFELQQTVTATGAATYTLASDFHEMCSVERQLDSAGTKTPLGELMGQEIARMSGLQGTATAYAVSGTSTLTLYPNPPSGTYIVTYIPQSPDLSTLSDGSNVDVVTPDGEEFLIWGVAVKSLAKSQDDVQLAMAEREAARQRLMTWAVERAFYSPRRTVIRDDGPYGRYWADGTGTDYDPGGWWNR